MEISAAFGMLEAVHGQADALDKEVTTLNTEMFELIEVDKAMIQNTVLVGGRLPADLKSTCKAYFKMEEQHWDRLGLDERITKTFLQLDSCCLKDDLIEQFPEKNEQLRTQRRALANRLHAIGDRLKEANKEMANLDLKIGTSASSSTTTTPNPSIQNSSALQQQRGSPGIYPKLTTSQTSMEQPSSNASTPEPTRGWPTSTTHTPIASSTPPPAQSVTTPSAQDEFTDWSSATTQSQPSTAPVTPFDTSAAQGEWADWAGSSSQSSTTTTPHTQDTSNGWSNATTQPSAATPSAASPSASSPSQATTGWSSTLTQTPSPSSTQGPLYGGRSSSNVFMPVKTFQPQQDDTPAPPTPTPMADLTMTPEQQQAILAFKQGHVVMLQRVAQQHWQQKQVLAKQLEACKDTVSPEQIEQYKQQLQTQQQAEMQKYQESCDQRLEAYRQQLLEKKSGASLSQNSPFPQQQQQYFQPQQNPSSNQNQTQQQTIQNQPSEMQQQQQVTPELLEQERLVLEQSAIYFQQEYNNLQEIARQLEAYNTQGQQDNPQTQQQLAIVQQQYQVRLNYFHQQREICRLRQERYNTLMQQQMQKQK